jgi:hypothetical protein
MDVVELQKLSRSAAAAGLAHERALAAIAFPNGPANMSRDPAGPGAADTRGARLGCSRELPLFESGDIRPQGQEKHFADISRRQPMAEERDRVLKQVVLLLIDCELHLILAGGNGNDPGRS